MATANWLAAAASPSARPIHRAQLTLTKTGESDTILKLTTDADPAMWSAWWEPRLVGLGDFQASLQEILYGETQVSFGELVIANPDAALDTYLAGWNWQGNAVTLDMGFQGLAEADYAPIFTGEMGEPRGDDLMVRVPLRGLEAKAFREFPTTINYDDTLPNIVQALLTDLGYWAGRDTDAWTAWAAANNFAAYYPADGGQSYGTILDALLANLMCWWGITRAGVFTIGTFTPPTGSESPAVTWSEDLEILAAPAKLMPRYWSVAVSWINDKSTMAMTTESYSESAIKTACPAALEGGVRATHLTVQANAQTVRDRHWNAWSVQRRKVEASAMFQPLGVELHEYVALSRPRHNIDGNWLVIGDRENHIKGVNTLVLIQ